MDYIEEKISKVLSGLELEVLTSYLDGKSYQEIASDLERHSKSIDNALQRVKRKLEKCLDLKGLFVLTNKKNDSKLYNWYIKEDNNF